MSFPGYGTGVQNVNLVSGQAPDYGTQMAQIQRQQQLAQALQQQSDQPIDINSYNGIQAPIPWTALLAKGLQKVGANIAANRALKQQKDLTKAEQQDAMTAIRNFSKAPDTVNQAADPFNNMAGLDQTSAAPVGSTIEGTPTTLAQKQYMLPQLAMQAADNPYLKTAFPFMQDQTKVDIRAIGPEGLAQIGPDGSVKQIVPGKEPAPPKLDPEEQFIAAELKKNPNADLSSLHAKWARAGHVPDDSAGWQVAMDPSNNNMPFRFNVKSGQAFDFQGKPYAPGGFSKPSSTTSFGLSPEKQAAIDAGVQAGLVDVTRLNRGNADVVASTLLANPKANLINVHAYAQQVANPALQKSAQQAARIPELLDMVGASGKALNYSDVQFAGKLEQWKNGQLNDPAFTRYMAQRNDALLALAGGFRGTNATDLSTKMEEEAAHPSMSPKAIDAWVQAHKETIKPMVDYYKNFAITNPQTQQAVNTPTGNLGPAKTVVRTGTEKGTGKKVIQYSDGTTAYAP